MKKKLELIIFFILISILLVACGKNNGPKVDMGHYGGVTSTENTDKDSHSVGNNSSTPSVEELEEMLADKTADQLFVILARNKKSKTLTLAYPESSRVVKYDYTDMTSFYDKYGQYTTVTKFEPGRVVTIGGKDSEGNLLSVTLTDEAWYQTGVIKYTIDVERGMLTIGDKKYNIDSHTRVFSKKAEVSISQIGEEDEISVQGVDKKVYSIILTEGHGTIALTNTELFEGGWISLGTKIYAKVEPNMTMIVPEGKYYLSVANDGYGDTKEVKVKRGKITVVDLSEYEGDGPSFCKITFEVYIEGARLYIDGQEVDYSEPLELKYGIHKVTVYAKGYEDWEQQLVVHSAEATIQIGESDMTEDGTPKADNSEEGDTGNNTSADNTTGDTPDNSPENNEPNTEDNTNNDAESEDGENSDSNDVYSDYLNTLNDLLDSLEE